MGLGRTLVLGFIAGVTIVLGLPIGRLRRPAPALRAVLNATAVGVLLFLVWDVLSHAWEPIDTALGQMHDGGGRLSTVLGYGALFVGGLAAGLLSLVAYEGWIGRVTARAALPLDAGGNLDARDVAGLRVQAPLRRPKGSRPGRWLDGWRCSSRWASGCTTSPRVWRSASRPRPARSP